MHSRYMWKGNNITTPLILLCNVMTHVELANPGMSLSEIKY